MTISLSMTYMPECPVCQQYITKEHRGDTASTVAFVGAAPYAVCPSCRQSVDEHEDKGYRQRADNFVSRKKTRVYPGVGHSRWDRS
jgi:hypothetical protein